MYRPRALYRGCTWSRYVKPYPDNQAHLADANDVNTWPRCVRPYPGNQAYLAEAFDNSTWSRYTDANPFGYDNTLAPFGININGGESSMFMLNTSNDNKEYREGGMLVPLDYSVSSHIHAIKNYLWRLSYKVVDYKSGMMLDYNKIRADPNGVIIHWDDYNTDKSTGWVITNYKNNSSSWVANYQIVSNSFKDKVGRSRTDFNVNMIPFRNTILSIKDKKYSFYSDFWDKMDPDKPHFNEIPISKSVEKIII